ncbi:30S ribosomal protein S1 [Leucothrix sargassi]|nr:30S ribosomal protein S1 [Leucothrix sargassi]
MFLTPVVNLLNTIVNKQASEIESVNYTWEELVEACDDEMAVTGYLTHKVESGYMIDFGGIVGFCPRFRFDLCEYDIVPELFLNKPLEFYVLSVDELNDHLVVSRIDVLKDRYAPYLEELSKGDVVRGEVSYISDRLVTLNLNGLTCIISRNEVSWSPTEDPSDVLSVGELVSAKLLKVVPSKAHLTASIKQLDNKHWSSFCETNKVGDEVKVVINSLSDFGYFVTFDNAVIGILHWSELSWTARNRKQAMCHSIGDELTVKISALDLEKEQVSFSLKAMTQDPADLVFKKHEMGDVVTGVIRSRTDFGLFVEISEGFNCLLHFSNLSWFTNSKNNLVNFRPGLPITCKIIDIDKSTGRIGLGLKQMTGNPFLEQPSPYSLTKTVEFPRPVRVAVSSFFQANCHNHIVSMLNEVQSKMRQHVSLEIDNIFFDDDSIIPPDILIVLVSDDYLTSDTCSSLLTFLDTYEGLAPLVVPIMAEAIGEETEDPFTHLASLPVDRLPLQKWRVKSAYWATINKALVKSIRYAAGLK